jgi:hypothetical protein
LVALWVGPDGKDSDDYIVQVHKAQGPTLRRLDLGTATIPALYVVCRVERLFQREKKMSEKCTT